MEHNEDKDSCLNLFLLKYILWIWITKQITFDQAIPNFADWLLSNRSLGSPVKTVLSYLPPINATVNEFTTIVIISVNCKVLPQLLICHM